MERAVRKFPTWPTDPLHALAVLGEEYGELTKDVLQFVYEPHKTSAAAIRKEAIQTAAMALRFAMSLDVYQYRPGEQHTQSAAPPAPSARVPVEIDWLLLLRSAQRADWQQVVLNGGPPCFALLDGKFCLRAKRWDGHSSDHEFVSLERLIGSLQEAYQDLMMNCRALRKAALEGSG